MPMWRRDSTSTDPAAGDEELATVLKARSLDLGAALALLDSRPKGSETRAHAVHVIGTDPRLDDALAAVGADIESDPAGRLRCWPPCGRTTWPGRPEGEP